MTLWRRHSTRSEILAFLRFGLLVFVLKSTFCRATSDPTQYRSRITQSQGALNPNPRQVFGATLSRGIHSFQGDKQEYPGPYVEKLVHIPGEDSVEPSSEVKRENKRQWHSTSDRNVQTEYDQHYEQFHPEQDLSLESEQQNVERSERAHLQAEFGPRDGRRQLHQQAREQEQPEDQNIRQNDQRQDGNMRSEGEGQPESLPENNGEKQDRIDEKEGESGKSGNSETVEKRPEVETEAVKEENEEGKETQRKPEKETENESVEDERKIADQYQFPEPYLLGPAIKDWDQQREKWLKENPQWKFTSAGKPRVLLVTGSSGTECPNGAGDNFYVRSLKLKIDYARVHDYELFYNFAVFDPLMTGFWVKLPIFRNLMLSHPEIEWIFWLDGDAIFTDILYEAPLEEFDGYNMVMEGWFAQLMTNSWLAANAGVVLLRNCQWSLDLIDKWSPYGPEGRTRDLYGKFMTEFFRDRPDYSCDDQSALSYLMITDESVMSKIKLLESKVQMSGYWKNFVQNYEHYLEHYHPGLGDSRWPWITHFTGCSLCSRKSDDPELIDCLAAFQRAYNFADNQIQAYWGLQYKNLSGPELIRIRDETDHPLEFLEVNPWQHRIDQLASASMK